MSVDSSISVTHPSMFPCYSVGAAICFDYDFPSFIAQASRHDINLMLQPSWTWGPLYRQHLKQDRLRAVEQGFTLFRCGSGGISGGYSPSGEVWGQKFISDSGTLVVDIPLQDRIWTVYSAVGDVTGIACCTLMVVYFMFVMWCAFVESKSGSPIQAYRESLVEEPARVEGGERI